MNDVVDKLSDIEEKLNSQPKLFNKTYSLDDPFDEDSWYEIWVNSTENYVVKAVYSNVWYGAEDLHISFTDQSFRLYMPGLQYPFANQMIFLKSETWNEYVDRPFGWEVELNIITIIDPRVYSL